MSDSGVPVEEIARLAGHTNSRTTELVYQQHLRPIMEKGVQALDQLFPAQPDRLPQHTPFCMSGRPIRGPADCRSPRYVCTAIA